MISTIDKWWWFVLWDQWFDTITFNEFIVDSLFWIVRSNWIWIGTSSSSLLETYLQLLISIIITSIIVLVITLHIKPYYVHVIIDGMIINGNTYQSHQIIILHLFYKWRKQSIKYNFLLFGYYIINSSSDWSCFWWIRIYSIHIRDIIHSILWFWN